MNLYHSETYISDLENAADASVGIDRLAGKKILITGATGTIGSFLVDLLLHYNETHDDNEAHDGNETHDDNEAHDAGITVYAADFMLSRLQERFADIHTDRLIFAEHNNSLPISFDFDVDYIIHAAGNAFPAAFNSDPVGTIIDNIYGTYRLLEYGRAHGASRMLYISSGEVYGQGDLSLDSFNETYGGYVDPVSPRSCYPNSKRTAETLCASYYSQYGLETVMVRPCHTYGPSITKSDNRAHAQFLRNVLNGEDIVMKSAGTQMRSYCYIADCASAILTILLNGKSGEAYNSANPESRATIAELAQTIADAAGKKVIFEAPDEKDLAGSSPIEKQVLDSSKLESLGWKGRYTLQDGVSNVLKILGDQNEADD